MDALPLTYHPARRTAALAFAGIAWPNGSALPVVLAVLGALVLLLVSLIGWAVLLRLRREREEAHRNALDRRWTPLLNDILTRRRPFWALDDAVAADDITAFLSFLHRHAMDATPSELKWIRIVARPYLAFAPAPLAAHTAEQRAFRVHQWSWLALPQEDGPLRAALDDDSAFVAMVAFRALIRRHATRRAERDAPTRKEFARLVVDHLPRFKDWRQKSMAALLAQVDAIARPLRRLLVNRHAATWARTLAAATLKQLEDAEAAPLAVRLLERERDLPLQTAALRLLETVGDRHHVPLLCQLCTSDNEVIRIRALSALSHVGDASDVPLFERALYDPSQWVARQAAMGLVRLGYSQALHTLAGSAHARASLAFQVLSHHRLAA